MRQKTGELEIRYIVAFILALIVLVALIIIFRENLTQFSQHISSIFSGIKKSQPPIENILGK